MSGDRTKRELTVVEAAIVLLKGGGIEVRFQDLPDEFAAAFDGGEHMTIRDQKYIHLPTVPFEITPEKHEAILAARRERGPEMTERMIRAMKAGLNREPGESEPIPEPGPITPWPSEAAIEAACAEMRAWSGSGEADIKDKVESMMAAIGGGRHTGPFGLYVMVGPCEHRVTHRTWLGPMDSGGTVEWCPNCGAIKVDDEADWRRPNREGGTR